MKLSTTLATAAMLVAGAIANAQDNPMTKITDGVYHFYAMGYGSLIVVGDNGVLVTDPAFTARAEMMNAEIAKVTDQPVTHVALSHEHFDHIGGTEAFTNTEILLQENGVDVLKLSPMLPMPTVTESFDELLSIDLGGQTVEMHHLAVSDGVASSVVRVTESNVIYSADLYNQRAFTNAEFLDDTNFVGLADTLEIMASWTPSYSISSHVPGNSVDAISEVAEMLHKMEAEVQAAFQAAYATGDMNNVFGVLFDIENTLRMPEYADWKDYDAHFPGHVRRMAYSLFHGG